MFRIRLYCKGASIITYENEATKQLAFKIQTYVQYLFKYIHLLNDSLAVKMVWPQFLWVACIRTSLWGSPKPNFLLKISLCTVSYSVLNLQTCCIVRVPSGICCGPLSNIGQFPKGDCFSKVTSNLSRH